MHQQSPLADDSRLPNHIQSCIRPELKDGTKSGVRFAFSRSASIVSLPLDRSQLAHLSALDYLRTHTHPTSKRLRVYHMCFPHSVDQRTENFIPKQRVSLLVRIGVPSRDGGRPPQFLQASHLRNFRIFYKKR